MNGDDDVIKRLRQSNHVSAYGPPPVSVSENQPPGHPPPPPHPASDLASYMYGVQPQQPQQQQHSPHQNKWSPAPPSGSVKEEPKPNMNQQQAAGPAGAAGGDMGQAPESPQQQEVCEHLTI